MTVRRFISSLSTRATATLAHLLVSLAVASIVAGFVFELWYPYPYRIISGGQTIFLILICVDVIIGPLITLVVATANKPRKTLAKDLVVIGILQVAALAYGMSTIYEARPVHLVFERDRFQVVHAVDIPSNEVGMAPAGIDAFPATGPTLLALRAFRNNREEVELTFQSVAGIPLSAQPALWIPFNEGRQQILARAKPVEQLKADFPKRAGDVSALIAETGLPDSQLAFLPLVSRQAFWTVLIDNQTARPVAYLDLDPYEITLLK